MRSHYEFAVAEDAPIELLKVMSAGKHISWFPTVDGYYAADAGIKNWRDFLYPADFFDGADNKYIYSLVSPSPLQNIDMARIRSYQDYLDDFDKKGMPG